MERARAYVVGSVLTLLVALPLAPGLLGDNFPISTYPMFSGNRQTPVATIPHAVVVGQDERRVLPPEAVANDEVVQAFETLRQALRQGPESSARLCARVAGWVAAEPAYAGFGEVQLVSDTYDAVDYFSGDEAPLSSRVEAECEVPR